MKTIKQYMSGVAEIGCVMCHQQGHGYTPAVLTIHGTQQAALRRRRIGWLSRYAQSIMLVSLDTTGLVAEGSIPVTK